MIFNLFKSKPTLKELIPEGFVDIHSHVLPGIDDGAKNIKESVELIEKMNEIGFAKIIATPHTYPGLYENNKESILSSYNSIKNKLDDCINIDFASEYLICLEFREKARNRDILKLKDEYVLIEMSYQSPPINLYETIFEINTLGYKPILAHPERYSFLFNDFRQFSKLKKFGLKFQLNLLSVVGYYGEDIVRASEKLLKNGMIDYVGSDIHNINHFNALSRNLQIKNIDKLNKAIISNFEFG